MKNKGFTLIELLAVIVILAVIALIAVPIVLGIINDSREESNKISVEMYAKAVKNALLLHEMNGVGDASGSFTAVDAYTIKNSKGVTLKLEYDGNEVICDTIQISSLGDVRVSGCKVNGEEVDYSYGANTLGNHIVSNYGGESKITTVSDFTQISSGLYKVEDDLGTSYYFRGNVSNNYVVFGQEKTEEVIGKVCPYGDCVSNINYDTIEACVADIANGAPWTEADCIDTSKPGTVSDIYWRIVRINGDGTIRLVYDGLEKKENGVSHTATIASAPYEVQVCDNTSNGMQFSNYKISNIKLVLDEWYEKNLKSLYEDYISDSPFCNDTSGEYTSQYGYDELYFFAADRINNNNPSLKCENKNDRYTVNDDVIGNKLLKNPIGTLSADEIFIASPATSSYLYSGETYWSLTQSYGDPWYADMYVANENGTLTTVYITSRCDSSNYGVRPVINLKADVKFTGTGTIKDPYVIVTE